MSAAQPLGEALALVAVLERTAGRLTAIGAGAELRHALERLTTAHDDAQRDHRVLPPLAEAIAQSILAHRAAMPAATHPGIVDRIVLEAMTRALADEISGRPAALRPTLALGVTMSITQRVRASLREGTCQD